MYKFQDETVTDTTQTTEVVVEETSFGSKLDTLVTLGWVLVPLLDLTAGYFNKTHWADDTSIDTTELKWTWMTEVIGASVMLTTWATGVFLKSHLTEEIFTYTSRFQVLLSIVEIYANWNMINDSTYQFQIPGFTKGIYAVHLFALFYTVNAPIRIAGFFENRATKAEE